VCINQKDEGIEGDRGRDGGTNFILRIKEQEARLILHEHDNDDDVNLMWSLFSPYFLVARPTATWIFQLK
jgi:hypothetical protein